MPPQLTEHRPTIKPLNEVLDAFSKLERPIQNNTALNDFLKANFGEAGSELEEVPTTDLDTSPDFIDNINSTTVADFVTKRGDMRDPATAPNASTRSFLSTALLW
jgi:hypothetical protein